jgi:hypothetical protein
MHLFNHVGESKWGLTGLMSFVDYTIFNASAAEFTNVNVGGIDIPAQSSGSATLTDAELAAVCVLNNAAVMQISPTDAEKASVLRLLINKENLDALGKLEPSGSAVGALLKYGARAG